MSAKVKGSGVSNFYVFDKLNTNLDILLEYHSLSDTALAKKIDVSQPVIHNLRAGKNSNPKIELLMKIAIFFRVSVSQLIGQEALPSILPGAATANFGWSEIALLGWEEVRLFIEQRVDVDCIKNKIVTDIDLNVNRSFALRVDDLSLMPRFNLNTYLIFEIGNHFNEYDLILVQSGNRNLPVVREVISEGGQIFAVSINPKLASVAPLSGQHKCVAVLRQARTDFLQENSRSSYDETREKFSKLSIVS